METERLERLRYAVAATRYGGGQASMAARVRQVGLRAFEALLDQLDRAQRGLVEDLAYETFQGGHSAVLLGDCDYPSQLASHRSAPAALFVSGSPKLLSQPGIGMCGSREASPEGLRAAHACADVIASRGYSVISGYARGVDLVAHSAALARGGTTVIVLAEGINHFRVRRGEFSDLWDPQRAVVISQFAPNQRWFTSGAMSRNGVICALGEALVVVEAGQTGGTLAAGQYALQNHQTVLALELFGAPAGNQLLIEHGAKIIADRQQLEAALEGLGTGVSRQLTLDVEPPAI